MKQTIEEAASEYMNIPPVKAAIKCGDIEDLESHIKVAFKSGAEWQAKQSSWISVNDLLPPCEIEVLAKLSVGFKVLYLLLDGYWTNGEYDYDDIEYWMPIPQ